jgi:peptide-methionine (S)-S-oxide reductase
MTMTKLGLVALAVTAAISASSAPEPRLETALLAGGCYWTMEAVFEHVRGVRDVVSGFAGPRASQAEAVRIRFDPRQISYAQLLRIYFTVAHDPTQVNRQGPDVGPQYRSAIFPQTPQQKAAATAMMQRLRSAGAFKRPIATRIEGGGFRLAPANHQDFVRRNPLHPYVLAHDRPKLAKLKRAYPQMWRA